MVTEGDIATWFVDAVRFAFKRLSLNASVTEWYVIAEMERYGPGELHQVPPNRRYGVWAHSAIELQDLVFYWDSLEESVSSFAHRGGDVIVEIRCPKYCSMQSFRDRISATVDAVVQESIDR